MITNGLYVYESEALDHGDGGYRGVVVLRDGTVLGGSSFFYFVGTYSCSGGKWKGELTQREHTPAPLSFATASLFFLAPGGVPGAASVRLVNVTLKEPDAPVSLRVPPVTV